MSKRKLICTLVLLLAAAGQSDKAHWALAQTEKPSKPVLKPAPASQQKDRVRIYSDKAIYKRTEKKAEAIGHVKIIQDNTTIYADKVLYDENTKQSIVNDGVKIVQVNKEKEVGRTTTITAAKMQAFHQEKRFIFRENARMDRSAVPDYTPPGDFTEIKSEKRDRTEKAIAKDRTVITSDEMEYFSQTENANLVGHVVMLQKDKQITGDKAFVRGEADGDVVIIEDNAVVTQINGNWLIKNKIIKPDPEDEEQQRFIREKLVIQADKITIFRATDDLKAEGNVKITQKVGGKERVAVGKEATFSDKQQLATLTGDVRIQRENADWLTAQQALFYTEREAFEAIGTDQEQVISEFTIDSEDETPSKEPLNPLLPDFNLDQHQPGERLPSWLRNRQQPQRAPAKPTAPRNPVPSTPIPTTKPSQAPKPVTSPSPQPTPRPGASASPKPAPSVSPTAEPAPAPQQSSFIIETE